MVFDKHVTPNIIAAGLIIASYALPQPYQDMVRYVGLFALSGALTNWLAVHMLFERVPGLYGSGVIPANFDTFKDSLEELITRQLFNKDSVDQVLGVGGEGNAEGALDLTPALVELDLDAAFDQLLEAVRASSLGPMLSMVGGDKALEPLREPFKQRLQDYLGRVTATPAFQRVLRRQLASMSSSETFISNIRAVIRHRLDELTPEMVKDIVKTMIKHHLGWLVVWGAVFGGVLGLLSYFAFA